MKKIIFFLGAFACTSMLWSFFPTTENKDVSKLISLGLNQKKLEDLSVSLDLNDLKSVFELVFFSLDEQVNVYPTENYYYFTFHVDGKEIWGNIRLPRGRRDKGFLCFAYWEFDNFPQQPDDPNFFSNSIDLGQADGVQISGISPFEYMVSYGGKTVQFNLNRLDQHMPDSVLLRKSERFLMRTCDESGLQFFLLFNNNSRDFLFILDESSNIHAEFITVSENFLLEKRTQFVFYNDLENHRKILTAVYAENTKRNNYYDGPFDQLADNYIIPETGLKECLYKAYPYARGFLDDFGEFTKASGYTTEVRMAITPYYCYDSMEDLMSFIGECNSNKGEKFYSALTYDYKKDVPR
jgi:hypothetical protein